MKVRLKYAKEDTLKYISHLDLTRVFERSFRRAKLPVAFTQGFNQRPKMTFAAALPVGASSTGEYMDIEFFDDIPVAGLPEKLKRYFPEGITILETGQIEDKDIKLSDFNMAVYEVHVIHSGLTEAELKRGIRELLNLGEIIIEKTAKGKVRKVNIAPLIKTVEMTQTFEYEITLMMTLSIGQRGNVSPPAVISELKKRVPGEIRLKGFCRKEMFYCS